MAESEDCYNVCIKVPRVVGIGECQVLVVTHVDLKGNVVEIDHATKTVEILPDESKVINGKVIIDGVLHKDIVYKVNPNAASCGALMYCLVDTPFSCMVDVPRAMEGDDFQVEFADVIGQLELLGTCNSSENSTHLEEKDAIQVVVKVTRTEQISVKPQFPDVCPPFPVDPKPSKS